MDGERKGRGTVHIGPAGWSYPDWNRTVYRGPGPKGLARIASAFDLVEINTTFYRPIAPALARSWLQRVAHNPEFTFTAKLWQGFSHERRFQPTDVGGFKSGVAPLHDAGRLGAILIQLPWSFRCSAANLDYLLDLAARFAELSPVVEVRHGSWDDPAVRRALDQAGVGLASIDQPRFPGSIGPAEEATAGVGYVRLHGRNAANWFRRDAGRDERYDYRYRLDELEPWAERIRRIAGRARRVYVVTNNHFGGSAVVNALMLRYLLDGRIEAPCPAAWGESFPELRPLLAPASAARPAGGAQRPLFC